MDGQFYYRTGQTFTGTTNNSIYKKSNGAWATVASGSNDGQIEGWGNLTSTALGYIDSSNGTAGSLKFAKATGTLGVCVNLNGVNEHFSANKQSAAWYGDPTHLIVGRAYNPQFQVKPAEADDGQDDFWLKYRRRDAFTIGREGAMGMLIKDMDDKS